jgi:hypothetical protein
VIPGIALLSPFYRLALDSIRLRLKIVKSKQSFFEQLFTEEIDMKLIRFALLSALMLLVSAPLFAQGKVGDETELFSRSGRLVDLSNRLVEQSENLSDAAYRNYSNKNNNNRSDAEALIIAQHFDTSAALFRRLVQDRRRRSELRDVAQNLSDLVRQSERYGAQRSEWNNIRRTVNEILSELNLNSGGGGGGSNTGRIRWSGTVDDRINLVIQGSYLEVQTLSGTQYGEGTFNFSGPLPQRRVSVRVNKLEGRGEVRVIQQPDYSNDFTAIIEIYDNKGGARDYQVEIYW